MTCPAPEKDCAACPRLAAFREANRTKHPSFFNAPVPSFGELSARLLVVGLAPGLKGANRTGRPFTGDFAGDLLYAALQKYGMTNGAAYSTDGADSLALKGCRITNAVRCVPPRNKPEPAEEKACFPYLVAEIKAMRELKTILALGQLAHRAVLKAHGLKISDFPFAHGAVHTLPSGIRLADTYHTSRYNVQTKRLTSEMFETVVQRCLHFIQ